MILDILRENYKKFKKEKKKGGRVRRRKRSR